MQKDISTIGRAETLNFPKFDVGKIPARIDTGARTSSIWASRIIQKGDRIGVVFFGKKSPYYTGKVHYFQAFERVVVASSNGQRQERYKIILLVELAGRKIRARFTLADRSTQVYPVLVGRNVLRGKFVVDVKRGRVLRGQEKKRSQKIQSVVAKRAGSES